MIIKTTLINTTVTVPIKTTIISIITTMTRPLAEAEIGAHIIIRRSSSDYKQRDVDRDGRGSIVPPPKVPLHVTPPFMKTTSPMSQRKDLIVRLTHPNGSDGEQSLCAEKTAQPSGPAGEQPTRP